MPTYISLVQFTDKGIQAAKETTHRVADWAAKVQSKGVSIKQMYWTLGQYDQVCVFEAPDDEKWHMVMDEEYQSLMDNGTWDLVPLPADWHAIGSKWVYKIKQRGDGMID